MDEDRIAEKIDALLWTHLSAEDFDEYERRFESGEWALDYSDLIGYVGPYEIDLSAGTVNRVD